MDTTPFRATLKQWGERMIGIDWSHLLAFSGAVISITAVIAVIQIVQNSIPIIFGDIVHIFSTLVGYGLIVAGAILAVAAILKGITYGLGKFLIFLSELGSHPKPFDIYSEIKQEGNEVYIEIKNKEWFIDALRVFVRCSFLYKDEVVQDRFEWLDSFNKNGETYIRRRKAKKLHFATIDQVNRTYCLHLLERELEFPFLNDRSIELAVGGFTSAPFKKRSKYNISHTLLVLESIEKGKIKFEIGVQL